jgi:hypothetical protein
MPHHQREKTVKNGKDYDQDGNAIQNIKFVNWYYTYKLL